MATKATTTTNFETPQTPEEMISLLERIQKDASANDLLKKIFEQDPIASENKFLTETVQNVQQRLQESELRFELLTKLNQNLAFELGNTADEFEALKRTMLDV